MHIWSLQDSDRGELLEAVLQPSVIEQTVAVIMLDLEKPGDIMEQFKAWMAALNNCLFNKVFAKLDAGVFDKMKQKILELVKTYEEPQLDENGKLIRKRKKEEMKREPGEDDAELDDDEEDVRVEMPLGPGILKVNLGIPIIVVLNKID